MVRKALLSDVNLLAKLFDNYRVFYRKQSDLEAAMQFLKARIENKQSVIFVCENDQNNLMGFVQLYPIFSSTRMQKLWLLNDLFVEKNARGNGISKKLIAKAKELARNTESCGLLLETEISNKIGNQLYPKTGFQLNKESNFYFWEVDK